MKCYNELKPFQVAPFTVPTGPTLTAPTSPNVTFLLFFTELLFEMIVVETKRYVRIYMGEKEYIKWTKMTIDELKGIHWI